MKTITRATIKRKELIIGFIVMLFILIIETMILIFNIEYVSFSSFGELITSPQKLAIYIVYILSVILIPLTIVLTMDFTKNIYEIYKIFVVKSLRLESIYIIKKYTNITPILISLSLLFITIGTIFKIYILLFFTLIPLIIYTTIVIKPVYDVYNHNKNIEIELRWFLILLTVIESVGANIKFLIDRLRHSSILSAIRRELLAVDRDSKLYYPSHITSFMARANVTPNKRLSDIFSGYASRIRGSGDVLSWLKSKINEELMLSEFSMKMYSERIALILGQLMLAVYAIMPLVSVAIPAINIYFTIAIAIATTPLLILLTYITQPRSLDIMPLRFFIVFPTLCIILVSMSLHYFIGVHSIVIGWLAALAITHRYRDVLKEIEILNRDSIEILRIMIELTQSGLNVAKALEYIATSNVINNITAERLRIILSMLRQGVPLVYIATRIPSYSFLFRFTVFTLGLIHECGGGNSEVFQMLYEYTTRIRAMRINVEKIARFFDIFAIVNVLLITWIWISISPIYKTFTFMGITQYVNIGLDALYLLIYISLIGYSLVSNTIRRGMPIFDYRNIVFLVVGIIPIILTCNIMWQ